MRYWLRAAHRVGILGFIGIVFLARGHLAGRLVGAAALVLAAFVLWRAYLRTRTRYRAKEVGECPWCQGDLPAQSTLCPHCQQEVSPLYSPK
jgi:hypothetical protein